MLKLGSRYYSAAVVPYNRDGSIDEAGLRDEFRYFAQDRFAAVGGVIANPEAGEIYYLTSAEKRRVIEIAMEEINGKMPVIAGAFDMTTKGLVEEAKIAKSLGVDGLFLMPPAGTIDLVTKWDSAKYPEYWLDQIKAVDAAVDMPIIAHPVAGPTPQWGIGVAGPTAKLICEQVPNVIGWKMIYSYEGMRQMWKIMRSIDRDVSIMAAGGRFFHEYLAHGVLDGTVSGSWNYALEPMLDHIEAAKANDWDKAREIWGRGLGELHDFIYSDYSRLHLRYKIATWLRGIIPSPVAREPMPKPNDEEIEIIYRLLQETGLSVIGQGELKLAS